MVKHTEISSKISSTNKLAKNLLLNMAEDAKVDDSDDDKMV